MNAYYRAAATAAATTKATMALAVLVARGVRCQVAQCKCFRHEHSRQQVAAAVVAG